MMYLLITSPHAKAKKIQTFLSNDYTVKSSCGHIRDLEKKQKVRYGNPLDFGIDVENDFKPTYKIMTDKKDTIVKMLKQNAEAKKLYLRLMMTEKGKLSHGILLTYSKTKCKR